MQYSLLEQLSITHLEHWVSAALQGIFSLTFIFSAWLNTFVQQPRFMATQSHTTHYIKYPKIWVCGCIKEGGRLCVCLWEREWETRVKREGANQGRAADNNLFNAMTSPGRFLLQRPTVTKALSKKIWLPKSLCWLVHADRFSCRVSGTINMSIYIFILWLHMDWHGEWWNKILNTVSYLYNRGQIKIQCLELLALSFIVIAQNTSIKTTYCSSTSSQK